MSLKFFLVCVVCSSFGASTKPTAEVFCGLGYYPKNDEADFSGSTPFTKCVAVERNNTITEDQCTPILTGGMYADLNTRFNWGGVQWRNGRCMKNDCETVSKNFITVDYSVLSKQKITEICQQLGCVPDTKGKKCYPMDIVTLIVIIVLSVVGFLVVIFFLVTIIKGCYKILKCACSCCSGVESVESVESKPSTKSDVVLSGHFVVIKLGSQQRQTKKAKNAPELKWAETVEFTGVGGEDDDITIELWNDAWLVGSESVRIVSYINKKTRVPVVVKDTAGDQAGVVEIDVDVQLDENQKTPKIKAVFFVEKGKIGAGISNVIFPLSPTSL